VGEAGRVYFHRLCAVCPKYQYDNAERIFTNALKTGRGENGLGTVFHHAEQAGVHLGELKHQIRNTRGGAYDFRERARTYYTDFSTNNYNQNNPLQSTPKTRNDIPLNPNGIGFRGTTRNEQNESDTLPYEKEYANMPEPFPEYQWPSFIQHILECGEDIAQRDMLFCGSLAALGATMCQLTYFRYGHKTIYPCLQVFVLAPAASGKGAINWIRYLAMPYHKEKIARYEAAMAQYKVDFHTWSNEGKARDESQRPIPPKLELFFISGNNSGTGIQENIIENSGKGFILEAEAEVLSTAIQADYGQWSHVLRKAHDHEFLSYNRRKDHEYRECDCIRLTVVICGTPGQLIQLIPGAENGLFSRQLFYYMPPLDEFKDMLNLDATEDYSDVFLRWGSRWKKVMDAISAATSSIQFIPSHTQAEMLHEQMSQLFRHAGAAHGGSMRSSVVRLAINLLRLMNVVALTRALDALLSEEEEEVLEEKLHNITHTLLTSPGLKAATGAPSENVIDGVITRFELFISDEDFCAVLKLSEPFYRHAEHALLSLPNDIPEERKVSSRERFLSRLSMSFTRQEYLLIGEEEGLNDKQCDYMIEKLLSKKILIRTGHGTYSFRGGHRPSDDELLSNFENRPDRPSAK
jgi:hypothetical protein